VPYSSLRCPQRAGSLSTLFLVANHTGQGDPLLNFAHKEPVIQGVLLGVVHKLGDSQDKITITQGTTRSKNNKIASKNDLHQLERENEELELKSRFRSKTYLTPKKLPTDRRGKDLGREIGVEML
jgi:hypothetical protein